MKKYADIYIIYIHEFHIPKFYPEVEGYVVWLKIKLFVGAGNWLYGRTYGTPMYITKVKWKRLGYYNLLCQCRVDPATLIFV